MPQSILVGLDGRDAAWRALQRALDLCGYGSRLTVCVVGPEATSAKEAAAANEVLEKVQRRLLERFASAIVREAAGDPAVELTRLATELDVDLLVVGHNNHARPRPAGLGSVSERIVQAPPCDVLVVR